MSITFPRTDILTGLRYSKSVTAFKPMWRQEVSRSTNGVTRVKNLGPLLWHASYATVPLDRPVAVALEAKLLSLDGGVQLFEGWDPLNPLPASDQLSPLSGVTVATISATRQALTIAGVPGGFVLSAGDWLSIDDGVNLHLLKAAETVTASPGGLSPLFEVRPSLHPVIAPTNPVVLRYAPARLMLEQDSVERSPTGGVREAVSWSAIQVIV